MKPLLPIYLDYNATSPLRPGVKDAMLPYLEEKFGNPSSTHSFGQHARFAVDDAREKVASLIKAEPSEIYFTGSGTEANFLALVGAALSLREKGRHLIANKTEHPAVLEALKYLVDQQSFEIGWADADPEGHVSPQAIERMIRKDTVLITVMAANNETGRLQDIGGIASLAHKKEIHLHSDAVQLLGKMRLHVKELGADSLAFSAHKIGGPKGVGAFYLKKGRHIQPVIRGGSQERGLRGGSENVAGIVGFGTAALGVSEKIEIEEMRLFEFRNYLEAALLQVSGTRLNSSKGECLPNTLNISFEGLSGEALVIRLDREGIAVSSGSACASGATEVSHVLMAMGCTEREARSSLRFSLGFQTTMEEIDHVSKVVPKIVSEMRSV